VDNFRPSIAVEREVALGYFCGLTCDGLNYFFLIFFGTQGCFLAEPWHSLIWLGVQSLGFPFNLSADWHPLFRVEAHHSFPFKIKSWGSLYMTSSFEKWLQD
jgi:hypothetical protein